MRFLLLYNTYIVYILKSSSSAFDSIWFDANRLLNIGTYVAKRSERSLEFRILLYSIFCRQTIFNLLFVFIIIILLNKVKVSHERENKYEGKARRFHTFVCHLQLNSRALYVSLFVIKQTGAFSLKRIFCNFIQIIANCFIKCRKWLNR